MKLAKLTIPLIALVVLSSTPSLFATLVDTNGNAVTNETALGDIDMQISTTGDLSEYISTGAVAIADSHLENATNAISINLKQWTTNTTVVGYTDWKFSGEVVVGHEYSINMTESSGNYAFMLYDTTVAALIGTVTTNLLNPTVLVYPYNTGSVTATRSEVRRNTNGFALYTDVTAVDEKLEDMDTSYFRFNTVTNVNQSVQYVYADSSTIELRVKMPETGMTKDWLVYVLAETNLNVILPPATYWGANESVTNPIPAYTPTALYFSQITDDTFSLGRKEFVPITVPSARDLALQKVLQKSRKTTFPAKRSISGLTSPHTLKQNKSAPMRK